jgi:hypothetical protein
MKIITTFVLLLCTLSCFAQSETPVSKWQIAALIVPQYCAYQNASEITDGKYAATRTFGIAYSLLLTRFLAKNWAVATEISYSEQTQNYEPNINLTKSVATYQRVFEFVKIPFFVQKNIKINKNTVFNANIGVQADILAKAQYYKDANILYTNTFDGSDERAIYQPINISAAAKIGCAFRATSRLSILLQVRTDATLFNPDKVENAYWTSAAGAINKTYLPTQPRSRSQIANVGLGLGIAYDL